MSTETTIENGREERSATRIDKVVRVGVGPDGSVFAHIQFDGTKLSISGVIGPMRNGNARGSCGQIDMSEWQIREYAPGWTPEREAQFRDIWSKWHLNDMRAGCQHQRAEHWEERPIYSDQPTRACVKHPDGGNGWNMLVWLPVDKGGLLSAPCPVCGYKYGTRWLHEVVPSEALDFLAALPDTDIQPAWV